MKALLVLALLVGCSGSSDPAPTDADVSEDADVDGNGSLSDGGIDASLLDLIDHTTPTHVCVGSTAVIRVRLNYYPGQVTTVSVYSSNSSKATVSPLSLVFNDVTWNIWQDVTVSGVASGYTVVLLGVPNYRAVEILLPVDC